MTGEFAHECFFIAPIGTPDSEERARSDGVLKFIVARAAEQLGLEAIRADAIAQPGEITIQVIDHVLNAKAAVADLTGRNPNVYYELAIRHTARLPVVLIADTQEKLPFDIAQMRTIFFNHRDLSSADRCREEIVTHLAHSFEGAVDSPVATTLDVRALQGGSAVERNVADLVTTVEEIAAEIAQLRELTRVALARSAASKMPRDRSNRMKHQLAGIAAIAKRRDDAELLNRIRNVQKTLDQTVEESLFPATFPAVGEGFVPLFDQAAQLLDPPWRSPAAGDDPAED